MKYLILNRNAIFIALIIIFWACAGKKEASTDSFMEETTWAAMDSYHMIMAESYHPLKDSANLAPARANAELLAAEAETWAATALPERVNNDDMKALIGSLQASSRSFADKVKAGAADEELATALTALHDEFHHIMETWEGGHEKHH